MKNILALEYGQNKNDILTFNGIICEKYRELGQNSIPESYCHLEIQIWEIIKEILEFIVNNCGKNKKKPSIKQCFFP